MSDVPVLRTPRLVLRGLSPADREAVVEVFADPATSTYLGADLSDAERARRMVERRIAADTPPGTGHWVIEWAGAVVGLAHLRPSAELPGGLPEIGWYLDRRHGGSGLATEAAAALLDHGLRTLGLPAVWALVHEDNAASLALARRLGFLDVGGGWHYGGPHRVHVAVALPAAGAGSPEPPRPARLEATTWATPTPPSLARTAGAAGSGSPDVVDSSAAVEAEEPLAGVSRLEGRGAATWAPRTPPLAVWAAGAKGPGSPDAVDSSAGAREAAEEPAGVSRLERRGAATWAPRTRPSSARAPGAVEPGSSAGMGSSAAGGAEESLAGVSGSGECGAATRRPPTPSPPRGSGTAVPRSQGTSGSVVAREAAEESAGVDQAAEEPGGVDRPGEQSAGAGEAPAPLAGHPAIAGPPGPAGVHHVELWVPDLDRAVASFGWLLGRLGWVEYQRWRHGVSWRAGTSYVVLEQSPALTGHRHDRTLPGLNHLAVHGPSRAAVAALHAAAPDHGWRPLFADAFPHAGGPDHYAAFLENADGFEVEVVAPPSE